MTLIHSHPTTFTFAISSKVSFQSFANHTAVIIKLARQLPLLPVQAEQEASLSGSVVQSPHLGANISFNFFPMCLTCLACPGPSSAPSSPRIIYPSVSSHVCQNDNRLTTPADNVLVPPTSPVQVYTLSCTRPSPFPEHTSLDNFLLPWVRVPSLYIAKLCPSFKTYCKCLRSPC